MRARFSLLLSLTLGCSSPGGNDAANDDPQPDASTDDSQSADVDAPAAVHVGGWRTRGGDASNNFRSATAGPGAAATATVFAENTHPDNIVAFLAPPVVDEAGNVYFMSKGPNKTQELVAKSPNGDDRWRTPLDRWARQAVLGPDGDLYVVDEFGYDDDESVSNTVISFDSETGARQTTVAAIPHVAEVVMPPDGTFYAMRWSEADGYSLVAHAGLDQPSRWTSRRVSHAYSVSTDGSTIVSISTTELGAESAAPRTVFALDATTGEEKWHYDLDPALTDWGAIAIGPDGSTYAASSKDGSDLTVVKLSPTGEELWTWHDDTRTWASHILIGSNTITVSAQVPSHRTGFTLRQSDGTLAGPAPCSDGDPLAIDSNDVIYWSCSSGITAATPAGTAVNSWSGGHTFDIALGPEGTAYSVQAAYFADHQLIRIK